MLFTVALTAGVNSQKEGWGIWWWLHQMSGMVRGILHFCRWLRFDMMVCHWEGRFMFCTQQVFNCREEQLLNWTDVCPTITIESQQKAWDSPGCAHHENTQGRRILADLLLLFNETQIRWLSLCRELTCQPSCCPVMLSADYILYVPALTSPLLRHGILLCVHFSNNLANSPI